MILSDHALLMPVSIIHGTLGRYRVTWNHITNSQHLNVIESQEIVEITSSTSAYADRAHGDPIIRSEDA